MSLKNKFIIAIAWVYGVDRFLKDCKMMLGHYPYKRAYWRFIWKYVSPLLIVVSNLYRIYVGNILKCFCIIFKFMQILIALFLQKKKDNLFIDFFF